MNKDDEKVIDAEVKETESEKKEEKKPNIFSRAWNKTKQSVNDSILEGKIESSYKKAHLEYTNYTKDEMLSKTYYGAIENDKLTVFGNHEVKTYSVIIGPDEKAYYVVAIEETEVASTVEGIEYKRPGMILTLDKNVEEVNVVKAGKRYFIYKGKAEEQK
ncbi:MAG: hypothetical protein K5892_08080 [Acholeplasmatales bacterium]|nr:hypothetical protein [Acholeplasmatales bacterium]